MCSLVFCRTFSGISTLLVVAGHLRNPILCNRLLPHVVVKTTFFTDSLFLTFSSMIGPTIRGLPCIKVFNFLLSDQPQAFATFTFSSYFLTNGCTVDSFIVRYLFLKNFAACDAPLSSVYFAIVYLSS